MPFQITCTAAKPSELLRDHLIIVPVHGKAGKLPAWTKLLPVDLQSALTAALESPSFGGKVGDSHTAHTASGYAVLLGVGEGTPTPEMLRRFYGSAIGAARRGKLKKVAAPLLPGRDGAAIAEAAVVGAALANYRFDAYRSDTTRDKIPPQVESIAFFEPDAARRKSATHGIDAGKTIAEAVTRVRDLVNTPANVLNPKSYASIAADWCRDAKIKLEVLGPREIERIGMGCVMAVGGGSANEPRFLIATYKGNKRQPKRTDVVLVGKGVTFDTGGISIKPTLDMWEMRGDMAGSAVMLSSICSAAKMKLPLNIVALTPLVENMPSGAAYRPGDVIRSLSGQTIEINSTDAEGRLILADALTYAQRFSPRAVIDIATLTGAIIVALGEVHCGIFTNKDALAGMAQKSADLTGEKVWRMPLHEDYAEKLATVVADMRNSAGREGGASVAAGFLQKFVGDFPWLHIDIAAVDLEKQGHPYCPKGASGFGARLVIEMLRNPQLARFEP
jgi:leucyl aminopeptidase